MLKGEENPQKENSLIKSDLFDLLEGEKAIRYFQSQSSIEEMKCKVMKQRIDQSILQMLIIYSFRKKANRKHQNRNKETEEFKRQE